jgi:thiol-disulfide isomerase/thioredoxin
MRIWPVAYCNATALMITIALLLSTITLGAPKSTDQYSSAELRDAKGNSRDLSEFLGEKGTAIGFWGIDCPLARLYLPTYLSLAKRFQNHGINFILVFPNESENLMDIASYGFDHSIPLPLLKDVKQKLTALMDVKRVPTVALIGADHNLIYIGRIDDQYKIGSRRQSPQSSDLADALSATAEGRRPKVEQTFADGCLIEHCRPRQASALKTDSNDALSILSKKCATCHCQNGLAPFPITTLSDVDNHSDMIHEVVSQRRMPPWDASDSIGHFINDRSLTLHEQEIILNWIDRPRSINQDNVTLPLPEQSQTNNHGFVEIISSQSENVPAQGVSYFSYIEFPKDQTQALFFEERWLSAGKVLPSEASVVHHMLLFICRSGTDFSQPGVPELRNVAGIIGWAPGDPEFRFPEGSALRIPPQSRLYLEVHYTPAGTEVNDRPKVLLKFADTPPQKEIQLILANREHLHIPAFDPHVMVDGSFVLPQGLRLVGLMPHMHSRGKSFSCRATYPNGTTLDLLKVPRYQFDWQTMYLSAEKIDLPAGTVIDCKSVYDNSRFNVDNIDPSLDVGFGRTSDAEMMDIYFLFERDLDKFPTSTSDSVLCLTIGETPFGLSLPNPFHRDSQVGVYILISSLLWWMITKASSYRARPIA